MKRGPFKIDFSVGDDFNLPPKKRRPIKVSYCVGDLDMPPIPKENTLIDMMIDAVEKIKARKGQTAKFIGPGAEEIERLLS